MGAVLSSIANILFKLRENLEDFVLIDIPLTANEGKTCLVLVYCNC